MTILVISASNRIRSQSRRIANLLADRLCHLQKDIDLGDIDRLDLCDVRLPLWDEGKWTGASAWADTWPPVSRRISRAQALLIVCPEWAGMAPPELKNLLLLCEDGELAHKPALLVGVSASSGGAYVIAELRMSGYKNNKLLWLPDHLIIRNAESFDIEANGNYRNGRLLERVDYALRLLTAYAVACRGIRQALVDTKRYPYGM